MSNTAAAPTDTSKKSKSKLIMIVAAIVLLGGGGAAYWTYAQGGTAEHADAESLEHAEEEEAHEMEPGAAVPLDTFIVNLASSGRTHFLRVTLSLVVRSEEVAAEVAENEVIKMRVRSAILELLALQTADHLVTPEGKTELKHEIAEAANHAFSGLRVTDVLFSEFVVQF